MQMASQIYTYSRDISAFMHVDANERNFSITRGLLNG